MAANVRDGYLGFALQPSLGAPIVAAETFHFVKYLNGTDVTVDTTTETLKDANGQDTVSIKTREAASGKIQANIRPDLAGALFQFLPGMATWDGNSAPALHTYSAGSPTTPYGTVQYDSGASSPIMVGDSCFSSLQLGGMTGEPLSLNAQLVGLHPIATGVALAGGVASYDPEPAFLYYNSPSISIDGVADKTVESFQLDVKLGLSELARDTTIDALALTDRDISLTYTRRYQNSTLWRKVFYGAGVAPTTSLATGAFSGYWQYGSGASLRSLQVDLPLLLYQDDALTELDPDGKTVREIVTAKAIRGATWPLVIAVRNGDTGTYVAAPRTISGVGAITSAEQFGGGILYWVVDAFGRPSLVGGILGPHTISGAGGIAAAGGYYGSDDYGDGAYGGGQAFGRPNVVRL